jgi:CDP-paratose 2-epimerase
MVSVGKIDQAKTETRCSRPGGGALVYLPRPPTETMASSACPSIDHARREVGGSSVVGPEVGFVAWFHFGDERAVRQTLQIVDELGVRRLRSGFSWADYERLDADGPAWFDWLLRDALGERIRSGQLDVLFNFLYTPWARARVKANGERNTASPPRRLRAYGRFIARMIARYEDLIGDVELLNEMDIFQEWDREFDWHWRLLARTLRHAAVLAHRRGRRVILGGPTRAEPVLLESLSGPRWLGRDALRHVDVVGLHGFPGTWDTSVTHASSWSWRGWETEVGLIRETCRRRRRERPIWVTETGSSTYGDPGGEGQLQAFRRSYAALAALGIPRMYWYGFTDLGDERETINNVIGGESREANPHSHHLGLAAPLRAYMKTEAPRLFGPGPRLGN